MFLTSVIAICSMVFLTGLIVILMFVQILDKMMARISAQTGSVLAAQISNDLCKDSNNLTNLIRFFSFVFIVSIIVLFIMSFINN